MWREGLPERKFVDSNVFLYVLRADPRYGERAKALLGEGRLVTSILVVSQVLAHLERKRSLNAIPLFLEFLEDHPVEVLPTLFEDFIEALSYARREGISLKMWDDLIIAAQMKREGIRVVVSNDRDFDRIDWIVRVF
ncbi:MAG: type II toxin-antitoxin system VapC family toxin [Candidatus Korarchaeota archaeon]|nr:type II toxin-antitoxin system VapC family toxin [Candidatus Korarchaeota archaeon]